MRELHPDFPKLNSEASGHVCASRHKMPRSAHEEDNQLRNIATCPASTLSLANVIRNNPPSSTNLLRGTVLGRAFGLLSFLYMLPLVPILGLIGVVGGELRSLLVLNLLRQDEV